MSLTDVKFTRENPSPSYRSFGTQYLSSLKNDLLVTNKRSTAERDGGQWSVFDRSLRVVLVPMSMRSRMAAKESLPPVAR